MKRVLRRLDSVHQRLLDTVTPLDADTLQSRPSENEWSIAEIIHHLFLVEERVLNDLEKAVAREPQRVPFLRRFLPTSVVSSRLLRVKSPQAVTPTETPANNQALDELNRARSELKAFCSRHGESRFRTIVFKHPFLGPIDGVATVSFVGYHERRHLRQIREVLRKVNSGPRASRAQ